MRTTYFYISESTSSKTTSSFIYTKDPLSLVFPQAWLHEKAWYDTSNLLGPSCCYIDSVSPTKDKRLLVAIIMWTQIFGLMGVKSSSIYIWLYDTHTIPPRLLNMDIKDIVNLTSHVVNKKWRNARIEIIA